MTNCLHSDRSTRYVIVTPVRNEASRIGETLRSVLAQTIRPIAWVIVDDGSSDGTADTVEPFSRGNPWISLIRKADRGCRRPGAGVMEAFYEGYRCLPELDWDFLVKFDGDLSIDSDYFERCFAQFAANPRLGIGGGLVQEPGQNGSAKCPHPLFHVRGATKIYRRDCWHAIGALPLSPGWDTFDEVKANMLGWETKTFLDIKLRQLKPTGSADGLWNESVKCGLVSYVLGYHPVFFLGKCVKRVANWPYVLGSLAIVYGYLKAYLSQKPRVDRDTVDYVRNQQLRRIFGRQSIWR